MVLEREMPMARYQLRSTSTALPVKKPLGQVEREERNK
jgi:hypothetical protein